MTVRHSVPARNGPQWPLRRAGTPDNELESAAYVL